MLAFFRARFPGAAASQLWSDSIANNWMDPGIPLVSAMGRKLTSANEHRI